DLYAGEHLTPEYHAINPNRKIPAIVDTAPADGGSPITVFESGAILTYLAEKYGRFLSTEIRSRTLTLQWMNWQVAGLGPMIGQASHFVRFAPKGNPYSVSRYVNEAQRLIHVLEGRLNEVEYLAGEYSIADMAVWPWIGGFPALLTMLDIDVGKFPAVQRWTAAIADRTAVKAAFARRDNAINPKAVKENMELTKEEWSNLFGEKNFAASRVSGNPT
ncbi:MAG TPA: glutathione binding-like protein, partial [Terriglobales bacterium]